MKDTLQRYVTLCLCLLFLLNLASCANTPDTIYSEYVKSDFSRPLENVLVIGVNESFDAVSDFESRMVQKFQSLGINAFAAQETLNGQKLSKESAIDLVERLGADSVIVTRLIATKTESTITEQRSELVFERPSPESLNNVFVASYQHVASEKVTDTTASVLLSSDLYTTANANDNRVWGIQFIVRDKKSRGEILDEAVTLIANKLNKDKLIN